MIPGTLKEITVQELKARLQDASPPWLIDVREDAEVARGMLPEARHIALASIPDRIAELSPGQTTVIYCHHGARSAQAVHFLQANGFSDVWNLTGGTDAWSRLIDPSLPRY